MGVQVTTTGRVPGRIWDAEASLALAQESIDAVDERTFVAGHGPNDAPLRAYSAGYVQELARRGEGTAVDLNRTGRLRAAVRDSIASVTAQHITLALRGAEAAVAERVSVERPFFALSPADVRRIESVVPGLVRAAMARGLEAP